MAAPDAQQQAVSDRDARADAQGAPVQPVDASADARFAEASPTGSPPGDLPSEGPSAEASLAGPRRGLDRRMVLPLLAILIIAGAFAVLLQSTSHSSQPLPAGEHSTHGGAAHFDGGELSPPKPAPRISLRNYLGGPRIDVSQYRGKAVLVTFLYTHCPDICPLIASNLRIAQNMMGPKLASKVQIIAVSVDPRGDTPQTVAAFLKVHGMTGRMKYLIGSAHELGQVWKRWGVGSEVDAQQPDFINHSALVYGIDASGKLRTIYVGDTWKPSEIAHDAPLLAAQ